jgi:hypothetical protein
MKELFKVIGLNQLNVDEYKLYLSKVEDNKIICLELGTSDDPYDSDYYKITFGYCNISNDIITDVDISKFSYIPKPEYDRIIEFDLSNEELIDYNCRWFSFSVTGGNKYYPCGYGTVDLSNWLPTNLFPISSELN